MALRKVIEIDEAKCDGCGKCVDACHEGAIALVGGKARLVSDVYCDGLGACVGDCPQGAITIVEREAAAFDDAAVARRQAAMAQAPARHGPAHGGGCPGSALRTLPVVPAAAPPAPGPLGGRSPAGEEPAPSMLRHWPVQLRLVPPHAPFLKDADLVVCADCVPFAVPDFHARYLRDRAVLVGCPKLDDLALYAEKLSRMLHEARPSRLTVLRMEVPCCAGIADAALRAAAEPGMAFPVEVHVVGIRGGIERRVVRG